MNDKVTVFEALTRRCHLRSQAAAAETADCRDNSDVKRLWCVAMSTVSSANWLHFVFELVQAEGRSMV